MKKKLPIDANGVSFSRPAFWLDGREYAKIISEINNQYYSNYRNEEICLLVSFGIDGVAYIYWFENHGFNNYNIFLRVVDNH